MIKFSQILPEIRLSGSERFAIPIHKNSVWIVSGPAYDRFNQYLNLCNLYSIEIYSFDEYDFDELDEYTTLYLLYNQIDLSKWLNDRCIIDYNWFLEFLSNFGFRNIDEYLEEGTTETLDMEEFRKELIQINKLIEAIENFGGIKQ